MKSSVLISGLMLAALASPLQAQNSCDRACLEGHISTYLNALYANTPDAVPLARGAKISDNNRLVGQISRRDVLRALEVIAKG